MCASMTSKRATIAETLFGYISSVNRPFKLHIEHEATNLGTNLAVMRLFSGVDSLMDRQCRPLDELFATTRVIAHMWPETSMNPFC